MTGELVVMKMEATMEDMLVVVLQIEDADLDFVCQLPVHAGGG